MPVSYPGLSDFFNVNSTPLPPETEEEKRRRLLIELGLLPDTDLPPAAGDVPPSEPPVGDPGLPTPWNPETPISTEGSQVQGPTTADYYSDQQPARPSLEQLAFQSRARGEVRQRPPTFIEKGRRRPSHPTTPGTTADILEALGGLSQPSTFPAADAGIGPSIMNFLEALPPSLGPIAVPFISAGRLARPLTTALTLGAGMLGEPVTAGDVLTQAGRGLGRVGTRIGEVEAGVARDLGLLTDPTIQQMGARRLLPPQPPLEGPLPEPRPPTNPLRVGTKRERAMSLSREELEQMDTGALANVAQTVGTSGRFDNRDELIERIIMQQQGSSPSEAYQPRGVINQTAEVARLEEITLTKVEGQRTIDALKAAGYDMQEAQDALDAFTVLKKSDFDDAADYNEARSQARDDFIGAVDSAAQYDEGPAIPPTPTKPPLPGTPPTTPERIPAVAKTMTPELYWNTGRGTGVRDRIISTHPEFSEVSGTTANRMGKNNWDKLKPIVEQDMKDIGGEITARPPIPTPRHPEPTPFPSPSRPLSVDEMIAMGKDKFIELRESEFVNIAQRSGQQVTNNEIRQIRNAYGHYYDESIAETTPPPSPTRIETQDPIRTPGSTPPSSIGQQARVVVGQQGTPTGRLENQYTKIKNDLLKLLPNAELPPRGTTLTEDDVATIAGQLRRARADLLSGDLPKVNQPKKASRRELTDDEFEKGKVSRVDRAAMALGDKENDVIEREILSVSDSSQLKLATDFGVDSNLPKLERTAKIRQAIQARRRVLDDTTKSATHEADMKKLGYEGDEEGAAGDTQASIDTLRDAIRTIEDAGQEVPPILRENLARLAGETPMKSRQAPTSPPVNRALENTPSQIQTPTSIIEDLKREISAHRVLEGRNDAQKTFDLVERKINNGEIQGGLDAHIGTLERIAKDGRTKLWVASGTGSRDIEKAQGFLPKLRQLGYDTSEAEILLGRVIDSRNDPKVYIIWRQLEEVVTSMRPGEAGTEARAATIPTQAEPPPTKPTTPPPTTGKKPSSVNRIRSAFTKIGYSLDQRGLNYKKDIKGAHYRPVIKVVEGEPTPSLSERHAALKRLLTSLGGTLDDTTPTTSTRLPGSDLWGVKRANDTLQKAYGEGVNLQRIKDTDTFNLIRDGKTLNGSPLTYAKGSGLKSVYDRSVKLLGKAPETPPVSTTPTPPPATPPAPKPVTAGMKLPELRDKATTLGIDHTGMKRDALRKAVQEKIDAGTPKPDETPPQAAARQVETPSSPEAPFTYPPSVTADMADRNKLIGRATLRENGQFFIRDFEPDKLNTSHTTPRGTKGREAIVEYKGVTGQAPTVREAFEKMVTAHKTQPEVVVVDNAVREQTRTHGTPVSDRPTGRRLTRPEAMKYSSNKPEWSDLSISIPKKTSKGHYHAFIKPKGDKNNLRQIEVTGTSPTDLLDQMEKKIQAKRNEGAFGPPPQNPSTPPPAPPSTPPPGSPGGPAYNMNDIVHKLAISLKQNLKELPALTEEQIGQRAVRFGAASRELGEPGNIGDPQKAFTLARRHLAGPLKHTTPDFKPLDLTDGELNHIRAYLQAKGATTETAISDVLLTSAINAETAITKLSKGFMVNNYETKLLERFFGPEIAEVLQDYGKTPGQRVWSAINATMSIPRHLVSSGDLSYPLRQGFLLNLSHPKLAARTYRDMLHITGSEFKRSGKRYARLAGRKLEPADELTFTHTVHDRITEDPYYQLFRDSGGVYLDPFGRGGVEFAEEQLSNKTMTKILEEVIFVAPSQRAFVSTGNMMRFDLFKQLARELEKSGTYFTHQPHLVEQNIPYKTEQQAYRDLARFLNYATGRGDIPGKELNSILSTIFFAPKYLASRFQALGMGLQSLSDLPGAYQVKAVGTKGLGKLVGQDWQAARLNPIVRNEILKDIGMNFGAMFSVLGAIVLAGNENITVETDIRSSDFLKIKIGNFRYDPFGGYQQLARYAAQLWSGRATALDTDELRQVGAGETLWRFARSKFNIPPALAIDLHTGETFIGKSLEGAQRFEIGPFKGEISDKIIHTVNQTIIPFSARDFIEVMNQADFITALGSLPSALGAPSAYVVSETDKTPFLHQYKTAEVFAADLIAERIGDPDLAKKILDWARESNPDRKKKLARAIDDAYNPPENSTFLHLVAGDKNSSTLFNTLKRAIENDAMAKSPELRTFLAAQEARRIPDLEEKEKEVEVPEPQRAPAPRLPNIRPWSVGYTNDRMAAQFGPRWGYTNPHDDKPVAYNQLPPEARKSISDYIAKLDAKTQELYGKMGETSWRNLVQSRKEKVLAEVKTGPRKPVKKPTETQLRKAELKTYTEKLPLDLEEQRKQTKGR